MKKLIPVILAAGKGTRMRSELPKVLHKACGKPLLSYVLDSLKDITNEVPYIVVGHMADLVKQEISGCKANFVLQKEQLGTGHAVSMVEPYIADSDSTIMVLNGDMPLMRGAVLKELLSAHQQRSAVATVLSAVIPDPSGYGRIVRDKSGDIDRIVEHKDASKEELNISEVNTGTYCFDSKELFPALRSIKRDNSQGEYYLTDVISIFRSLGRKVSVHCTEDRRAAIGINTPEQLAEAENILRQLQ